MTCSDFQLPPAPLDIELDSSGFDVFDAQVSEPLWSTPTSWMTSLRTTVVEKPRSQYLLDVRRRSYLSSRAGDGSS
jgi:hypothetical protein